MLGRGRVEVVTARLRGCGGGGRCWVELSAVVVEAG